MAAVLAVEPVRLDDAAALGLLQILQRAGGVRGDVQPRPAPHLRVYHHLRKLLRVVLVHPAEVVLEVQDLPVSDGQLLLVVPELAGQVVEFVEAGGQLLLELHF